MDRPVFDAANSNIPADYIIPTEIPEEKRQAREWLAMKMAGAKIKTTILPPSAAPAPRAWKPSKKRPTNTNRNLVSWPLLEYLQRNGRHEDAELVERYRGLVALMEMEPLQGQEPVRLDGLWIESRSSITDEDVDEAAEKNWPSDTVPGGAISYKGERQAVKAPGTSAQSKPTDEKTVTVMRPMDIRFSERTLIAQIDQRGILPRLRAALGPVVAPFEDAVLVGATFGQIGEVRSFKGKQAEAAGKALVMTGLDAVTNEWALIGLERRRAEEQAERNVERKRAEIAARRAAFLGRAA